MKNIKISKKLLLTLLFSACVVSSAFGKIIPNCDEVGITVDNQNKEYEVSIDDLETLSTCSSGAFATATAAGNWDPDLARGRTVFDAGPYAPGEKRYDSLKKGQLSYAPGGKQKEAHIILIDKDGNRSRYDKGKIDTSETSSLNIEFQGKVIPVTITREMLTHPTMQDFGGQDINLDYLKLNIVVGPSQK